MSGKRRRKEDQDDDNGNSKRKANASSFSSAPPPPKCKRPAPPPPPPKALVTLLKKNKGVQAYFKSLNDNLDADVEKWKDRARHYQNIYEQEAEENARLRARLAVVQQQGQEGKPKPAAEESGKNGGKQRQNFSTQSNYEDHGDKITENGNKHATEKQVTKDGSNNKNEEHAKGEAVDDTVFEFESSSDESDDDHKQQTAEKQQEDGDTIEKPTETIDNYMFEFLSDDDEDSKNDEDSNSLPTHKNNKMKQPSKEENGYEPIDESMFEVLSSDDDDDKDDDDDDEPKMKKKDNRQIQNIQPNFWEQHRKHVLEELVDAYRCLDYLGVELVAKTTSIESEQEPKKDAAVEESKKTDNQNEIESTEENAKVNNDEADSDGSSSGDEASFSFMPDQNATRTMKRQIATINQASRDSEPNRDPSYAVSFERCSNEDVAADIMRAIRNFSRLHTQYKSLDNKYRPFRVPPLWIPCEERLPDTCKEGLGTDHPIRISFKCIVRALCVMDTWCGYDSLPLKTQECSTPEEAWKQLFDDPNQLQAISTEPDLIESIRVGMFDRKSLVDELLDSLFGEISDNWAMSDRLARTEEKEVSMYDEEAEKRGKEASGRLGGIGDKKDEKKVESNNSLPSKLHKSMGAKSQTRLSMLAERRVLGRILVHLLLSRKDSQRAFRLIYNYVTTSVPSLELEEYPRLQPVLNLVVLEGMLCTDEELLPSDGKDKVASSSWFGHVLDKLMIPCDQGNHDGFVKRAFALSIHSTAAIWRQRLHSLDERISDIARVELAAYGRMLLTGASWLGDDYGVGTFTTMDDTSRNVALFEQCTDAVEGLVGDIRSIVLSKEEHVKEDDILAASITIALHMATVLFGDEDATKEVLLSAISLLISTKIPAFIFHATATACCMTLRQMELRNLEGYRRRVGCFVSPDASAKNAKSECISAILQRLSTSDANLMLPLATTALECCRLLSDGESANMVLEKLIQWDGSRVGLTLPDQQASSWKWAKNALVAVKATSHVPTARVINLKRRTDRMDSFLSNMLESGVLVVKALAVLETTADDDDGDGDPSFQMESDHYYGCYAIDGSIMKVEEAASYFFPKIEPGRNIQRLLEAYVADKWRPNDLKPFDIYANPDETALVRISDTERACALSHISAWKGVIRSLSEKSAKVQGSLFQHGEEIQRVFRHSGIARGPPLKAENSNMLPTPVCVIFEDDAILVDRFVERLDALLEELPRDFHFCSLGYGRPKTAPLVKFSPQLGIPTCIWYLTGYIISLEGAQHLMNSLPVRGPVDSWIGLKMCANWDNRFGTMVGVGVHSKVFDEAPTRKDLAKILNFRAYAAQVPLCNQRVGATDSMAGESQKNWRQRDTDITYSGSRNYRNVG